MYGTMKWPVGLTVITIFQKHSDLARDRGKSSPSWPSSLFFLPVCMNIFLFFSSAATNKWGRGGTIRGTNEGNNLTNGNNKDGSVCLWVTSRPPPRSVLLTIYHPPFIFDISNGIYHSEMLNFKVWLSTQLTRYLESTNFVN